MVFFREILEVADCYPEDKRYTFLRGVLDYGLNGDDYLSKNDYFASSFVLCKSIIDRQQRRYAEKINRYKQKKEETPKQKPQNKRTPLTDKEEDIIKQVLNYWNIQGLPKVERVTVQRKENVRRLLIAGEETYMILNTIKKLKNSRFLCGDNARSWKATFDWLFSKTENYHKVKKGFYDNKNKRIENKKVNNIW